MTVIDLIQPAPSRRLPEPTIVDTAPSDLTPVPTPVWHAGLWGLLAVASLVLGLGTNLPVAGPHAPLAVALSTLASAVGVMLFQLGAVRFSVFGRPMDLFVGLSFGALALVNVLIRISEALTPSGGQLLETNLYLLLFAQTVASSFFLVGLVGADRVVVEARQRARFAVVLTGAAGWSVAVGVALITVFASTLPPAVESSVRDQLNQGIVMGHALMGQALWLRLVDLAIAVILLVASLGYMRLSWHMHDPHVGSLAVAMTLLFFSQLWTLFFPPVDVNYISTGDVFRLAAYVTLLLSLVARIGGEIAERAARQERLRLSRDLHDGLAQQLSLLNLRLARAASPSRPQERRDQDLEAARRVVDAALLEARQAISALRVGRVAWAEFTRNLRTLADEFAMNHELDIDVRIEGTSPRQIDAALQVEILRIVNEAFSNAVRHGAASHVDIVIGGTANRLDLYISDNGRGLPNGQVPSTSSGVGLRSMAERIGQRGGSLQLEAGDGPGITLRASLPL
jgi:signal transduction histidine kinase